MRYLLTTDQAELMHVIESYRKTLRIKAEINESLERPLTEIRDMVNLHNLYDIFFNSLEEK